MEDLLGTVVGKVVLVLAIVAGITISTMLQRARNKKLALSIEPILRERGPLTLPELATAMGMGGFYARGKVALALNDLAVAGQVEIIPAPEGTPQLQKVNHIRYRLRA
ncbi:Hypothetical protein A7982_05872 [Minicystis rosea]|nr:Hypothetical protein A7982_05872 [Minicystis rosea]